MTVTRLDNEWRICRESSGNPFDAAVRVGEPAKPSEPAPNATLDRYGVADRSESISLRPLMADRSVVTRPEHPLSIPPRQTVFMYVGMPVWVRLGADGPERSLGEFPAYQPTETWWGPDTMEGEVCYATLTYGRLRLGDVVVYPHRVLAAVRIQNDADKPLYMERLNLPARTLSIFAAPDGRLWSEEVTLARTAGEDYADLTVGKAPPAQAGKATLVSPPRDPARAGVFRAFGRLFR